MSTLPRNKLGLLLIAAVLLFSMPAFIYVATVQQDNRIRAAKKELTCDPVTQSSTTTPVNRQNKARTITDLKKIQTSLASLMNQYQRINGSTPEIKQQIRQAANNRKKLLSQAIQDDPSAALALIETDKTLEKTLNNATSNCTATPTNIEGTLHVGHADFLNNTSEYHYTLTTRDSKKLSLQTVGTPKKALVSQMRVKAQGYQLDNTLLLNTKRADAIVPFVRTADVDHAKGEQKTVVIINSRSISRDAVNRHVFTTINNYYKDNSYGKISLVGETVGPYAVADAGCLMIKGAPNGAPYNTQSIISAADADVDFTDVGRILIFGDFTRTWGGYGMQGIDSSFKTDEGSGPFSVAWIDAGELALTGIVAHELGHNFGVAHAVSLTCGSAGICSMLSEYGDAYDVMGGFLNMGHMNAAHKDYIGWFDSSHITTVTESGTHTLAPIENNDDALKALKIPRGTNDYLYVEFRQPIGPDRSFESIDGTNVFEGALLHILQDGNPQGSALFDPVAPVSNLVSTLAALEPDESFTDPVTKTVISVTDVTDDGVTVDVDYKGPDVTPDPDENDDTDPTPDPCQLTPTPNQDDTDTDEPDSDNPNPTNDPESPDNDDGDEPNKNPTRTPKITPVPNDQKSLRERILERIGNVIRRPTITVVVPTPRSPVIPTPRPPMFNFPDWFPFKRNTTESPQDLGEKIEQDVQNRINKNSTNQQDLGEQIRSTIPTPRKPGITVSIRQPSLPDTRQTVQNRLREAGIQSVGTSLDNPCDPTPSPNNEENDAEDLQVAVTVVDGDDNPVQRASVTLNNGSAGGCSTNRLGLCTMTVRKKNTYKLYASKTGYSSNTRNIDVQKDLKTEIRILEQKSVTPTAYENPDQNVGPQSVTFSILLYNDIIDCYSDRNTPRSCDDAKKIRADLNSDGDVNQLDYSIFITRLRSN